LGITISNQRETVTEEQTKISEAFENFLGSYLSEEDIEKIIARYGSDIAARVKSIYDDAIDSPVDWSTATMDSALTVLHELLTSKYPWLTKEARSKINWAFIMTWK
jgi:hypothetical protein